MSNEKENVKNVTREIFIHCIIYLETVENDHLSRKFFGKIETCRQLMYMGHRKALIARHNFNYLFVQNIF